MPMPYIVQINDAVFAEVYFPSGNPTCWSSTALPYPTRSPLTCCFYNYSSYLPRWR